MKQLILKSGKEKPIRHRHHWIFSGAIQSLPPGDDGEIVQVVSATGDLLGHAYVNRRTSIVGRMINFGSGDPEAAIRKSIDRAIHCRESLFDTTVTNAYRLIHGEGDGIPGLTVDRYDDVLVIQVLTLGIERLKPMIIEHLKERLKPRCIYEKSKLPGRKEEGLPEKESLLWGSDTDEIEILELGHRFLVSVHRGQKTGFFLDQREMRRLVGIHAKGKRVLNCFGYTGGYSVYALHGGATAVDTVDISNDAIALAVRNSIVNGFSDDRHRGITADAFEYLRTDPLHYELIILDPPAFAKKKTDVVSACRGYKDINRLAMEKMPPGSLLVTSSCSYHVDEKLFQTVVFQAALEAKRDVRIISRHAQAADHPVNIYHPEGEYLKSLVLFVE